MGYTGGQKRVREAAPMASRVCDPRPQETRDDVARFVRAMEREFAGEPERYDEIFTTMHAFQDNSINVGETVDRVKVLLSGYPQLLNAFNQFVAWYYIRAHGAAGGSSN